MYLTGINFSDFDAIATILEALRPDEEIDTECGGEMATGTSFDAAVDV